MGAELFLVIVVALIAIFSWVTIKLGKIKTNKLLKFIPSILLALGIGFFYIKLEFISIGYEGIIDIIVIMFLAIACVISLSLAVIIEILDRRIQ